MNIFFQALLRALESVKSSALQDQANLQQLVRELTQLDDESKVKRLRNKLNV